MAASRPNWCSTNSPGSTIATTATATLNPAAALGHGSRASIRRCSGSNSTESTRAKVSDDRNGRASR